MRSSLGQAARPPCIGTGLPSSSSLRGSSRRPSTVRAVPRPPTAAGVPPSDDRSPAGYSYDGSAAGRTATRFGSGPGGAQPMPSSAAGNAGPASGPAAAGMRPPTPGGNASAGRGGPPAAGGAASVALWASKRAAANREAAEHDPAVVSRGRESWLFFTVPEEAVAGAKCVMYVNRQQSDALRNSGRTQLHAKFNAWEVAPPEGDRLDMRQETRIPRSDGVDFYRAELEISEQAYELNFVFSNGEGEFDNNDSQNYLKPVSGPVTRDVWIDTAPERAEAAWRAKKAEEARRMAEEAAAAAAAAEADDQRKAVEGVEELKREYGNWRQGGATHQAGRWRLIPSTAQPGQKVLIQYNRLSGPFGNFEIPADQKLTLKIGHNNWKSPQDMLMLRAAIPPMAPGPGGRPMSRPSQPTEEWWEALYTVPLDAAALNFVFTYFEHYDNNEQRDFKAFVELPSSARSIESWADGLLPSLKQSITAQRKEVEEAAAALKRTRRMAREAAQDKAEAVRRKQMRHVLFTVPEVVEAGQEVTVYYNPNNTSMHGRQAIWIKGGFNRWRHPRQFGPVEMTPPLEGDHFQFTTKAPKDAYSMDFVFTDAPEWGQFDNNGGLDYTLPIEGAVVEEPPLHVVHVAVEMAPICKVGGLGDVVTSLGRAVQEVGHQVEVILPRYDFFQQSPLLGNTQYETEFDFGGTKVYVSTCIVEGLRCFFIEPHNGMFSGPVYKGKEDAGRFDFFSRAALEFLLRTGRQPDILHCHDWSSAEMARAYWTEYHSYGLWKPRVVFTIHNMDFGAQKLGEAAFFSQKFTTVSPSYGWEIGSHPAISSNAGKLMGVRNGIDIDIWNPETDIFLPMGFTADNVVQGKAAAREELRRRLGMTGWGDKPMVGVVSRLTKQKGTHLIAHTCYRTVDRGGQFVLLGSAPDPKIQNEFNDLKNQYGGDNAAFCFAFDEPLSHLIYAACDIIVVPSMFEPCGLTQMIAMRYGAVPVVRQTGGLRDTVFDVDNDKPRAAWEMEGSTNWMEDGVDETNGFSFEGTDEGALDYALNRALDAYYNDREWFHGLQARVMRQDWSWNKPAHTYVQLYHAAIKG